MPLRPLKKSEGPRYPKMGRRLLGGLFLAATMSATTLGGCGPALDVCVGADREDHELPGARARCAARHGRIDEPRAVLVVPARRALVHRRSDQDLADRGVGRCRLFGLLGPFDGLAHGLSVHETAGGRREQDVVVIGEIRGEGIGFVNARKILEEESNAEGAEAFGEI